MFEGPQSGKFAIIHEEGLPITHMFNWNLDISHTPETYYASNTRWGADRNPGVIDWTGNFSVFDGKRLWMPGEFFKCVEFFTAPTSGVLGNVGQTYTGQAIVESNVITWAWGPEQSLTQQINFASNGCVANRNRVIDDTTILTPNKMCGLQLEWGKTESPVFSLIDNVEQAVLTLQATNPSYVNSSTGCCTHRRPGNIDWTLALTLTDHRSVTFTRNDLLTFRLFNSITTFWELAFGMFVGTSGVVANRQTGEIQQQVSNFSMKALSANSVGHIAFGTAATIGLPANIWWPPVPTTNTTPGTPTVVAGSQEGAAVYNVDLTWTAPPTGVEPGDDIVGYTIWASLDGVDFAVVGCSADTSYKDVGVPPVVGGADYDIWYKINAFNAQGQGPFSDISAAINISET